MSDESAIEWTDATWNPTRGCTKISPGCKHCYAETFAERFRGVPGHPYSQGFDLRLVPEALDLPFHWKAPRRVFVNSMSDLFHKDVPIDYIGRVFDVMRATSRHRYQILTKCALRMWQLIGSHAHAVPAHVWLGVSVEDRVYGVPRIRLLQQTPAAGRFLSVEPLLDDLGPLDLFGIGWIIIGGESGPGARAHYLSHARAVIAQADKLRIPVFVKQLGAHPVGVGAPIKLRNRKGNDLDDFPADLRRRELPAGMVLARAGA